MADRYLVTLDELLADPLVKLVMTRDGVDARQFRTLFERDDVYVSPPVLAAPPHQIAACCGAACG